MVILRGSTGRFVKKRKPIRATGFLFIERNKNPNQAKNLKPYFKKYKTDLGDGFFIFGDFDNGIGRNIVKGFF
jgi:hypothetical protein